MTVPYQLDNATEPRSACSLSNMAKIRGTWLASEDCPDHLRETAYYREDLAPLGE